MLQLTVSVAEETWDEVKEEFVSAQETTLELEHSLVSISKWESKWCKPFLSSDNKTADEIMDYIKCMTLTPNVDPDVYSRLTTEHFTKINEYINAPMTATTFSDDKNSKRSQEIITSELIYYWMIALQIPIDQCQDWHLNRLLTLVRVCNIKNAPPKKMGKRDLMSRNAKLNAARRQQLNTKG